MNIEFNLDLASWWERFSVFGSQDPVTIALQLFLGGGWVIFLILLIVVMYQVWLDARQGQYAGKWQHVILAIDIPKNNEQTPKAVENIFAALAGAQSSGNLIEKYWAGKNQESFSFEVVSLEGYIQFLIRTPSHLRDLVEAAIYAQYPDAEITEVEDYAQDYAHIRFPNEKYNLWGTEFVLVKDYPYPIRTYSEFEHTLTQTFLDPMAGLLEILSRLGPGEQAWLQLVVTPMPPEWGEKAKKIVKELSGQVYTAPSTLGNKILNAPVEAVTQTVNLLTSIMMSAGGEVEKKKEDTIRLFNMSPGDRLILENIQKKIAKHPFRVKFRLVYLAEQGVFNKGRGVAAIIGSIKQFSVSNANGFKPGPRTKTSVDYFRVKKRVAYRQNRILRNYIKRSNYYGDSVANMLLNNEELASLWHFPVMTVKAPMVEKIESKKVVPPTRLPIGNRDFIIKKETRPVQEWPEASPAYAGARPHVPIAPSPMALPTEAKQGIFEPPTPPRKPPTPPANLPTV
ncbi:hypothetical protein HZA71_00070 [Candidatus Falkowbacteria bacterium]|nr:hypothetical protein [Candidatus Falkowbacteria bacterium]